MAGQRAVGVVEVLTISQEGRELEITLFPRAEGEEGKEVFRYTIDDKYRKDSASTWPLTVRQKASWSGSQLVIDTDRSTGAKSFQTREIFTLSSGGEVLTIEKAEHEADISFSFARTAEELDQGKPMMSQDLTNEETSVSKVVFVKVAGVGPHGEDQEATAE
jgi:hypothetical protein